MKIKNLVKGFSYYLTAIVAGVASAYAMAPNYFWPGMFVGLSLFYYLYSTGKRTALIAFLFGIGYHVTGLNWIGNALLVEGNAYRWVWPISVIGLPTLLSLFIALFAHFAKKYSDPYKFSGYLIFAVALAASEWVRGHIFSGFPWNLYGHMWNSNLPMLQSISLFGMFTLTFLTLLWCSLPAYTIISKGLWRHKAFAICALFTMFVSLYAWGANRLENNPTQYSTGVNIRVVQPNIRQDQKWDTRLLLQHFNTLLQLSEPYKSGNTATRTYILWPESAMPPTFVDNAQISKAIAKTLSLYPHDAYLITGILRSEADKAQEKINYYNSMAIYNNKGKIIHTYDKSHLVPLGEYIPFQEYIPIGPVVNFSGFQAGTGTETFTFPNNDKMTPLICYEVIFPFMAKGGRERADFILNSTNDGWYGDSAGPHQHLSQSIIRGIEHGMPMIRSANTGISSISDSYGRNIAHIPFNQRGSIQHPVPTATENRTFYNRFGDRIFFIIALFATIFAIITSIKNNNSA